MSELVKMEKRSIALVNNTLQLPKNEIDNKFPEVKGEVYKINRVERGTHELLPVDQDLVVADLEKYTILQVDVIEEDASKKTEFQQPISEKQ
jgi:hypothetical protein